MNSPLFLCGLTLFACQPLFAQPIVEGNTISWPNDGWYQVQNASTYEQICGGTRNCTVDPGTYIVINHTTQERFEGIQVRQPELSIISVNGNIISWPDNGWYQVQDAETFEKFCGGERSCTVEPGEYIVVNHSTRERFEGVVVSGDTNDGSVPVDTRPEIRPQNLSIVVYSNTAAELSWQPNGFARPLIERNEVRRNGVLIATLEGEFLGSYFDATREPGRSYQYEITAVSPTGSATARISDTGFEGSEPPPVSNDTLPADIRRSLDTFFAIANGDDLERLMPLLGLLGNPEAMLARGFIAAGTEELDGVVLDVFTCPGGGEVRYREPSPRLRPQSTAESCDIGSLVFTGVITPLNPLREFNLASESAIVSDALIEERDSGATITLEYLLYWLRADDPNLSRVVARNMFFEATEYGWSADELVIDGADQANALPDGSLGFTIRGRNVMRVIDGERVDIRTLGPLTFANGHDRGWPDSGQVRIKTPTQEWLIDAFDGNPDTFLLNVTKNEVTTAYSIGFSESDRFALPAL